MSATPNQLETLIHFMEKHPEMSSNYVSKSFQGRHALNKVWSDLAARLNATGLPSKSAASWRKVWTDFKYRAKRKCSQNLLSMKKTGGGPSEEVPISNLEEKAVQMASLRASVSGSSSNCFGAMQEPESVQPDFDVESILLGQIVNPFEAAELSMKQSYLFSRTPKREPVLKEPVAERKNQEAVFNKNVLRPLERRNDTAERQLKEN